MSNIDSIFSDTMGIGNPPSTSNSNLGLIDVVEPLPNLGVEREPLVSNIVNPVTSPSVVSTPTNSLAPPKMSTSLSPSGSNSVVVQPAIKTETPKIQEAPIETSKVEPQPIKTDNTPKNISVPKKKLSSQNMTFLGIGLVAVGGILFLLAKK